MPATFELNRARRALAQAAAELAILEGCAADPLTFRDLFVSAIAMLTRVGAVVDDETKGRRNGAFGEWWRTTQEHDLRRFLADVRNAEFKRGEIRTRPRFGLAMTLGSQPIALRAVRRDDELFIVVDEPLPDGAQAQTAWSFVGGSWDGQDVLTVLNCHLAWLREIVARAEGLLDS